MYRIIHQNEKGCNMSISSLYFYICFGLHIQFGATTRILQLSVRPQNSRKPVLNKAQPAQLQRLARVLKFCMELAGLFCSLDCE